MANKTYSFLSFCVKIVVIFATVITVACKICDIGAKGRVSTFSGNSVRFSLNTCYATKEVDTIRWRFQKQDSDVKNLIVEYHFNGNHPAVELESLKGRAVFNETDYSLTINKVSFNDQGTYVAENRDRNDGRITMLKFTVLSVTDVIPQTKFAPAGTPVHLSLKTSSLPEKVQIVKWQLCKQSYENCRLIVEYQLNDKQPWIQLESLNGRAEFKTTDYSLVIEKVYFNDSGIYIVDVQHSPNGTFKTINNINLIITDVIIPQTIFAPAGTSAHLSLKNSCLPEEVQTLKWQLCKQSSENCSLIVEYLFNGEQPLIQLETLKGRVEFKNMDCSLVIEKVHFNDAGSYIVDVQLSPDGSSKIVNNLSLIITGEHASSVFSVVVAVSVTLLLGAATLFSCFWIPGHLKLTSLIKPLTTKLIKKWKSWYTSEEWHFVVGQEEDIPMNVHSSNCK